MSEILDCPKCHEPMRSLKAADAIVDRCEKCYGIWLDRGERNKILRDPSLVAGLDIGPAEVGEQHDKVRAIDCPRCGEPMQHVTDRAQKHVGFEICRKCEGSFLDAGELTDLSEFSLNERIRTFLGS